MITFFKGLINNYYWIYVFLALWTFIGLKDIYSYIIVLLLLSTIVTLKSKPIKLNAMDGWILVFILYQLISYLFSNYPFSLFYYGIKAQIVPIAFYFIGRNRLFSDNKFLVRMKWSMMFAFICGLILYFWSPGWYIARKTIDLTASSSTNAFYEVTRLSSFWPWSYAMGYGSLYFIMYFAKDALFKKGNLQIYCCLITSLLVLFFAQQRVSIAFFIVFMVIISFWSNVDKKRILKVWLLICLFGIILFLWITNHADTDFIDYILNRSLNSDENIISQRFELFSSFWNVSILGEGLGKYGHSALIYNMPSITDCEYIRFMAELGIIGCVIFFYICFKTIYKAFCLRKYCIFELCIILFFLVAMIGATPFENLSMQPFLFWYCLGRIYSGNRSYYFQKSR